MHTKQEKMAALDSFCRLHMMRVEQNVNNRVYNNKVLCVERHKNDQCVSLIKQRSLKLSDLIKLLLAIVITYCSPFIAQ